MLKVSNERATEVLRELNTQHRIENGRAKRQREQDHGGVCQWRLTCFLNTPDSSVYGKVLREERL